MQPCKNHFKCFKEIISSKCNWSLLFLSVAIFYMLVSPYDSLSGFDMLATFFGYMILLNIGIFLVSILAQKGALSHLKGWSLASLAVTIMALLAQKSLVIPEIISVPLLFIAIVNFLFLLKKIYLAKN